MTEDSERANEQLAELMEPYFEQIEAAVLAAAPEREKELIAKVFKDKQWVLTYTQGHPSTGIAPFEAFPVDKEIRVSASGLAMLWCIAVYTAITLDIVKENRGQGGVVDVGQVFGKAHRFIDYAQKLRTHHVEWPANLRRPTLQQASEPFQTIDRLFFGGLSWILLHEIAHVHLNHTSKLLPADSLRQEEDADQFATRWFFEEVSVDAEREVRILFVGTALAWLLLFEPLGGDAHHPPAVTRLIHVGSFFEAESNSVALEVVSHLLKVLFFPTVEPVVAASATELFDWTQGLFRQ